MFKKNLLSFKSSCCRNHVQININNYNLRQIRINKKYLNNRIWNIKTYVMVMRQNIY